MGLAGITLGAIIQSVTTVLGGAIVGIFYGWKLALVGSGGHDRRVSIDARLTYVCETVTAITPFLLCTGYIRLASILPPTLQLLCSTS